MFKVEPEITAFIKIEPPHTALPRKRLRNDDVWLQVGVATDREGWTEIFAYAVERVLGEDLH